MNQASRLLSTYTADVSGVCSALYELGGLTVMHDASGCNSTYNTHDEPRWYDRPSMVYISALKEIDAIFGGDDKLIRDIVETARQLQPRFIAIAGSPIPMLIGTDFSAVAGVIEQQTGIPTLGLATNGMHDYLSGISMALCALARRFCHTPVATVGSHQPSVNILGATPLDFSITGNIEALCQAFQSNGYEINSCWAMNSDLDQLANASAAQINVVVSSSGLALAQWLKAQYGTPYFVGIPWGKQGAEAYFHALKQTLTSGQDGCFYTGIASQSSGKQVLIIGEAVNASSVKAALLLQKGWGNIQVACPFVENTSLLDAQDIALQDEKQLRQLMEQADVVIADPLYRRFRKNDKAQIFVDWPHEAYSGRIYRQQIPVLVCEHFDLWQKGWLKVK